MKHQILGLTISVLLAATPALAAQKPKGTQPKPHTIAKSVAKPQASSGRSSVKIQGKSSVKPVKVKSSVKVHAKSTAAAAKTTTVKTSKKTTSTYASVPGTTTTLSPVQQKLQRNTNLAAKLRSRLPAGTDLMLASAGFRSLGQFVSAVNASYNHNLAFDGLKQRIVYDGMSLGQAMQDMRYADTTVRRR
jgi:hypothetical protein